MPMRYRRTGTRYLGVVTARHSPSTYDLLVRGVAFVVAPTAWRPAADVAETQDAIIITVELAGVADEDVEIVLHDDVLIVDGIRRPNPPAVDVRYHAAEIRPGPFRLEVPLPAYVQGDEVSGEFERGLLRVRLPKVSGRSSIAADPAATGRLL
ncbi:MAG: Hsp20/alpha crystallin family protein [Candidatus Limnocylindrales bacterium]